MPEPAASLDFRLRDTEKMAEVLQRQHIEDLAFLAYCAVQHIAAEGVCSASYDGLIFLLQCYFVYCTAVCVFGATSFLANLYRALCDYFSSLMANSNQQEGVGFWAQIQRGMQPSPHLRWLVEGLDPFILCQRVLMSGGAVGVCVAVVRLWRAAGRGEDVGEEAGSEGAVSEDG